MKLLTVEELKERYNNREKLEFKFFWGGFLSNWYESEFVVNGVDYWCVEQYMMAKKAELFGDTAIQEAIMRSTDQREIKQFGREVRGYIEEQWASVRKQVVFDGNVAKFAQREDIGTYLIRTGNKILVEASPFDKIWGVGMASDSPLIKNPNNWLGTNYLGFVLMAVREELKSIKGV